MKVTKAFNNGVNSAMQLQNSIDETLQDILWTFHGQS